MSSVSCRRLRPGKIKGESFAVERVERINSARVSLNNQDGRRFRLM